MVRKTEKIFFGAGERPPICSGGGGIVAFMNLFGGFVYDACKAAVLRGTEEEATGQESSHEDETGRGAPHEHQTKGSDAPTVPKSRAWTGMFGSGAPTVPRARA